MLERVDAALGKIEPSEQVDGIKQEATSLDLLQAVYRNPQVPLPVRMRAAGMAIPYEFPKLSVVANIDNQDFANRLEAAIKRSCVKLTIERARAPGEAGSTGSGANFASRPYACDRAEGPEALI